MGYLVVYCFAVVCWKIFLPVVRLFFPSPLIYLEVQQLLKFPRALWILFSLFVLLFYYIPYEISYIPSQRVIIFPSLLRRPLCTKIIFYTIIMFYSWCGASESPVTNSHSLEKYAWSDKSVEYCYRISLFVFVKIAFCLSEF